MNVLILRFERYLENKKMKRKVSIAILYSYYFYIL